ncbi:MAG: chemotaxis protein CheA [Deltaproteobacteria bacterium]|nr:chemotaxis protein CheA [Deltaproteobacteria bacterium]MBT4525958.1 chemotaxis protein CheA [Deltaproteobacteria bacterium]
MDRKPTNAKDFLSNSRKLLRVAKSKLKGFTKDQNFETIESINSLFQTLRESSFYFNFDEIENLLNKSESFLFVHCSDPKALDSTHIELLINICTLLQEMFKQQENKGQNDGLEEKTEKLIQQLEHQITELQDLPSILDPSSHEQSKTTPFDPEMLDLFISESFERLEDAEENLLLMETAGQDSKQNDFLKTCFRQFHTLKGNANLIGIQPLEWLMHSAESLLEGFSNNRQIIKGDHYRILLKTIDVFRQALTSLSNYQKLTTLESQNIQLQTSIISDLLITENIDIDYSSALDDDQDKIYLESSDSENDFIDISKTLNSEKQPTIGVQAVKQKDIRIGLEKLDQMVNLVGELVTVTNIISHQTHIQMSEENDFSQFVNQLQQVSNEIHEQTMSMRMVPIANSFRRMSRLVYDISKKSAKQVSLTMSGENTEIDKTLVELIADPVLHLIRNAVDHGIEIPAERIAAEKPPTGNIHLQASQIGNEIWIIVRDDGKGLDREKILKKARKNGLIDPSLTPPDETIWKIIFEAGFSTAKEISALSGRGVGLDIVKQNLDKLSASINIESQKGIGTTFTLRFPLTLAVIETLLVKIEDNFFSIPLVNMIECVELKKADIEKNHERQIARIRGELVPYIRLRKIFEIEGKSPDIEQIVVVEYNQQKIGLLVDQSLNKHQTIIKSLGKMYAEVENFSGITILGDGKISLIIDVNNLIKNCIEKEAIITNNY